MKKIFKTILAFSLTFFVCGCQDRMDYNEVTEYDKDAIFSSFNLAAQFVTNIYSTLENGFVGYNNGAILASASDESDCAWANSNVHYFYNGAWSPLKPLTSQWDDSYAAIRACNFFLEDFANYKFEDYQFNEDYNDQMERYNRYQYEVRFLRAYHYFNLVRTFGDVPFIDETISQDDANKLKRTPKNEIFQFIVDECDAIDGKLPVSYSQLPYQETGRITKMMVLALKGRTLMYKASPLFNESNDKDAWRVAALANKKVIEECLKNGIQLGKYSDLWGNNSYKSSEMILARRTGNNNSFEANNFPIGVEGGNSGNCPTQTLVDAYRMKLTGKLWNEPESGYDENNPYSGRDPRFEMTIAYNGTTGWPAYNSMPLQIFEGGRNGAPLSGATTTGYYLKKFCDGSVDLRPATTTTKYHSWIIFRLGEFYLNYAECVYNYFENPDMTDSDFEISAVDALNVIRKRTDVDMPELSTGLGTAFIDYYRNERMVELAFEGHRFWDVRRWKIGDVFKSIDVMKISNNGGTLTYTRETKERSWDEKMYFFPIPDSEIRKNPSLEQNQLWKENK